MARKRAWHSPAGHAWHRPVHRRAGHGRSRPWLGLHPHVRRQPARARRAARPHGPRSRQRARDWSLQKGRLPPRSRGRHAGGPRAPDDSRQPDRVTAAMTSFSPREIVSELDRYIVGQKEAKRAVAIALRNRWRRQQLTGDLKEEVLPKNILMIGPTGCGKTEISRRLAKLAGAPFLKVEATKFTEVGYVGRDVDSIVRDLVEVGISLTRETRRREVKAQAEKNAEERVLDALVGQNAQATTRETFRRRLRANELNDKEIEIQVAESGPQFPTFDIPGGQVGMINLNEMLGKAFGQRTKPRKLTVGQAYDILIAQES